MKLRGAWTFVVRDTGGARGRLFFFMLCVAIGVLAVVAVAGLADAIEAGLASRSRELLAADLSLEARRPLPPELETALAELAPHAERTDLREMATMAGALERPGAEAIRASRLCELKVVDGRYPFYGQLGLEFADPAPAPDATPALGELLGREHVVVAPELLSALELEIGDALRIGGATFTIAAAVSAEPDRLDFSLTLGPRILMSAAGFDRTQLEGFGNRVSFRTLLAFEGSARQDPVVGALRDALRERVEQVGDARGIRIQAHFDGRGGVRRGLERFESFLGLVALLSLVLGGIGVAQVVRTWLAQKTPEIAVWKSLGLLPREILGLHLAHVLLLALIGSSIGACAGGAVPLLVARLAPDFIDPASASGWPPAAMARGIGLGLAIAGLFALVALAAVWRVPPALVLRSGVEPLAAPLSVRAATLATLGLGLVAAARIQGGRWDHALAFTGGLAVMALALYLGARLLVALVARLPRTHFGPYTAHGLAALARPGAGTVGAIVALGLGTLVVVAMALIERRLGEELRGALPEEAPSVFFVDIQPDQWVDVEELLLGHGARGVDRVPVVMARLAAIDGVTVDELAASSDEEDVERARWALTREQRLTWLEELPESNTLIEGEWFGDPDVDELSLEEDFAADLGVGVGSRLSFNLQGVPLELTVTSLRRVEWESFAINFFLAVEPGVLDGAPQMLLAAAQVPDEQLDAVQNSLVEQHPNVTMLRIKPLLDKLAELFDMVALGVQVLGSFTVLAGIAILAGAVGAAELTRARDAALYKTLGVTRREVLRLFATEFFVIGLVAGGLGALGAQVMAWLFLEHVTQLEPELPPLAIALGLAGAVLLTVLSGLLVSGRALNARPGRILRGT